MKVWNIAVVNNIIHHDGLAQLFAKVGGIKVLASLLGRNVKDAYTSGYNVFREISQLSADLSSQINDASFLQIAVKLLAKPDKVPVEALTNAILTIRNIASHSETLQKAVSNTPGFFEALCGLFKHPEFQTSVAVLQALTKAIASVVADNVEIQNMCIETGIASPLLMVCRANKYRDLQTSAITVSFIAFFYLFDSQPFFVVRGVFKK